MLVRARHASRGAEAGEDAHRILTWPKAVREGGWKLVMQGEPKLFQLSDDRNSQENLAVAQPERFRRTKSA